MDAITSPIVPRPHMGSFKRSWLIAKSSWRILMLDKEMLVIPAVTGTLGLIVAIVGLVGGFVIGEGVSTGNSSYYDSASSSQEQWSIMTWVIWVVAGLVVALLGTYTLAAISSITLSRLRGQDPTISSGLKAVRNRIIPLTLFGILSFGIIQILQIIREQVPFIGATIISWLGEVAWRVAAMFTVPIIVDSSEKLSPIAATKQSISIVKGSWKETAISRFGIAAVVQLIVIAEIVIGAALIFLAYSLVGIAGIVSAGALLVLILLATVLVSEALLGVAKAVLYFYATTGTAPEAFDKQLLEEAFTSKKARKIFS